MRIFCFLMRLCEAFWKPIDNLHHKTVLMYLCSRVSKRVLKCLMCTRMVSTSSSGEYPQTSSNNLPVETVCPWCCIKQCNISNSVGVNFTILSCTLACKFSGIIRIIFHQLSRFQVNLPNQELPQNVVARLLTRTCNSGISKGLTK